MKATPLLFKAEMIQALLREIYEPGTGKTQTRRTRGLEHVNKNPDEYRFTGFSRDLGYPASRGHLWAGFRHNGMADEESPLYFKSPLGGPGDLIWCRETWQGFRQINVENDEWEEMKSPKDRHDFPYTPVYKADNKSHPEKWQPSIFLPTEYSRITDYITDVRVERLQDISEEDAKAEGIEPVNTGWKNYESGGGFWGSAINSFETLWISINGADSWDRNDWVFVYSFRPIPANVDAVIANPEMYGIGFEPDKMVS